MRLLKSFSVFFTAAAVVLFAVTLVLQAFVRDTEGPTISMDSDVIEISVSDSDAAILAGVTATDKRDGDVTASLVVESLSNIVDGSERIASIAAFDSDNHVTKTTRTVRYTDYISPHFTLTDPFTLPVGSKSTVMTKNLTATDCIDGDITGRISRANAEGSTFNSSVPGYYPVEFSVSNSAGDVERFIASVEVYDSSTVDLPAFALTDALIYLPQGSSFEPLDYLRALSVDSVSYRMYRGVLVRSTLVSQLEREGGDPNTVGSANLYDTSLITINNPVDTSAPGWYEVSYTVTSATGTERSAFLLVRVEE